MIYFSKLLHNIFIYVSIELLLNIRNITNEFHHRPSQIFQKNHKHLVFELFLFLFTAVYSKHLELCTIKVR